METHTDTKINNTIYWHSTIYHLPSLPILLGVIDSLIKRCVQVVNSGSIGPWVESQPRDWRFYWLSTCTSDIRRFKSWRLLSHKFLCPLITWLIFMPGNWRFSSFSSFFSDIWRNSILNWFQTASCNLTHNEEASVSNLWHEIEEFQGFLQSPTQITE